MASTEDDGEGKSEPKSLSSAIRFTHIVIKPGSLFCTLQLPGGLNLCSVYQYVLRAPHSVFIRAVIPEKRHVISPEDGKDQQGCGCHSGRKGGEAVVYSAFALSVQHSYHHIDVGALGIP